MVRAAISTMRRAVRVCILRSSQAPSVVPSSASAPGASQGASSGTLAARESSARRIRSISSSEIGLSFGIVPE